MLLGLSVRILLQQDLTRRAAAPYIDERPPPRTETVRTPPQQPQNQTLIPRGAGAQPSFGMQTLVAVSSYLTPI